MSNNLSIFHIDMNHVSLREDYLRALLRRVASMGYNAILWELEDKVRWQTCPEAVWPEAISKDLFRSLLAEAEELGLEPIPLLQTIGHAEYVLMHDRYKGFREQPERHDCYCTSNPEVRKFLRRLISEYLELFGPLRYFHLGGDEARVFATCPRCQAAAREKGANCLYNEHIMDISEPIFQHQTRPGIWSDMVLHHPEQVEAVDRQFIIWDWNYWDGLDSPAEVRIWGRGMITADQLDMETKKLFPKITDEHNKLKPFYTVDALQDWGYDTILCSAARSSGDTVFCGRQRVHADNIAGAAQKARQTNLPGHCVTSWAVRIFPPHLHELELMLAITTPDQPSSSLDELLGQIGKSFFGIPAEDFFTAVNQISEPFPFAQTGGPGRGSAIQWNLGMKDSTLPPPEYLKNTIENWLKEDNGKPFAIRKEQILSAGKSIADGLDKLKNFSGRPTTEAGNRLVAQWLQAADLQKRMNETARELMASFEPPGKKVSNQTLQQAQNLRNDFHQWCQEWMTPQGAEHTAKLVFDPVIEAMS